jgi:hypothetical protein
MIGIHLPNDDVSQSELDRIIAMGCKDYVLYVHAFDQSAFSKYNLILDRFAQGVASAAVKVHLRIEARGPLSAIADSQRLKQVHDALGGRYYSICIRNEPNIESPDTPEYYSTYVQALIQNTPTEMLPKLALAPISPGKAGYLAWYSHGIIVSHPLNKMHIHAYGNPQESATVFAAIRSLWSHELICTEHNFGAGRTYSLQTWANELPGVLDAAEKQQIQSVSIFIWRWKTPDMTLPTQVNVKDTPMEIAITKAAVVPVNYSSPNHEGIRSKTLGLVMHATRGGSATTETEFDATVGWFNNPASKSSSHVLVSPTRVWYPVPDNQIAWHAGHKTDDTKSLNPTHLGMEICQSKLGDAIPVVEYNAAVREAAKLIKKYGIPAVHGLNGIIEHYETAAGQSYGKSDIKLPFSIDKFVADVKALINLIPPPVDTYWTNMRVYGDWALARIANKQDPRNFGDFLTHLKNLGCDYHEPNDYGWPA